MRADAMKMIKFRNNFWAFPPTHFNICFDDGDTNKKITITGFLLHGLMTCIYLSQHYKI